MTKGTAECEISPPNRAQYRRPTQQRGRVRFEQLLDAAQELIDQRGIEEITLYDIAELAGVAASSVYHFFPTKQAVLVALVHRYRDAFKDIVLSPVDLSLVREWDDLLLLHLDRVRAIYNEDKTAMYLLLGPGMIWEVRLTDASNNDAIAEKIVEVFSRYFIFPARPDPVEIFSRGLSVLDSIWRLSVIRHLRITDELHHDACNAMHAYLRSYLPKYLERTPAFKRAAPPETDPFHNR